MVKTIAYKVSVFLALFIVLILFFPSCSNDDDPQIEVHEDLLINEIYASSGEDWIELYNSTAENKNIGGYKIFDDEANKYQLPEGTIVPANGFLVLLCDDAATGLHTSFKLSATGESVFLENSSGKTIDIVEFPALKDGESFGRYPDGSEDLKISGTATRGTPNGTAQGALVASVARNIIVPAPSDPVLIRAEILSSTAINEVKLFYRFNEGTFSSANMQANQGFYEGVIPAYNTTGEVQYYVSVKNGDGLITLSPFNAPEKTYSYLLNTDPLPQLRINEFMAINTSCCADTDGDSQEFDDWIEIYNSGTVAVDLGGMYLSDDKNDPFKSKIPLTNSSVTTLQPGGFIVVWADEQGSQGELHANFKLSSSGEDVGLFYKDGRTIHSYTYGVQQENVSMGLNEDGATWSFTSDPTPGDSNEF